MSTIYAVLILHDQVEDGVQLSHCSHPTLRMYHTLEGAVEYAHLYLSLPKIQERLHSIYGAAKAPSLSYADVYKRLRDSPIVEFPSYGVVGEKQPFALKISIAKYCFTADDAFSECSTDSE